MCEIPGVDPSSILDAPHSPSQTSNLGSTMLNHLKLYIYYRKYLEKNCKIPRSGSIFQLHLHLPPRRRLERLEDAARPATGRGAQGRDWAHGGHDVVALRQKHGPSGFDLGNLGAREINFWGERWLVFSHSGEDNYFDVGPCFALVWDGPRLYLWYTLIL